MDQLQVRVWRTSSHESQCVSTVFVCVSSPGKGEQSYPDLLALLIALLVTVIVALGVKNSVGFNNVLNVINLIVWVFMMIAGLFFVNGENWDEGRFLPFGWSGVCTVTIHADNL